MKKEYVVYSMRLAGYLMMNGFVLKRMEKSKYDDSNRNVFVFNESENLLQTVKIYKSL